MPNRDYTVAMARYNLWQNDSLLDAAGTLSVDERRADRGAFFGSIEKTLSHILWGDRTWLARFTEGQGPGTGIPQSTGLIVDWDEYRFERASLDRSILAWAKAVPPEWFQGDLTWFSGATGREITMGKSLLVLQLFNHQTHHRGQIHAMLTAAGARPQATDIPFMPDQYRAL